MMFWSADFVRGLAEGVLDRARLVRRGLSSQKPARKSVKTKKSAPKSAATKAGQRKRRG